MKNISPQSGQEGRSPVQDLVRSRTLQDQSGGHLIRPSARSETPFALTQSSTPLHESLFLEEPISSSSEAQQAKKADLLAQLSEALVDSEIEKENAPLHDFMSFKPTEVPGVREEPEVVNIDQLSKRLEFLLKETQSLKEKNEQAAAKLDQGSQKAIPPQEVQSKTLQPSETSSVSAEHVNTSNGATIPVSPQTTESRVDILKAKIDKIMSKTDVWDSSKAATAKPTVVGPSKKNDTVIDKSPDIDTPTPRVRQTEPQVRRGLTSSSADTAVADSITEDKIAPILDLLKEEEPDLGNAPQKPSSQVITVPESASTGQKPRTTQKYKFKTERRFIVHLDRGAIEVSIHLTNFGPSTIPNNYRIHKFFPEGWYWPQPPLEFGKEIRPDQNKGLTYEMAFRGKIESWPLSTGKIVK
ncbi:MAG TPA: hypothetical protein VJ044_07520 [Candidatus Hodarchaeales archaeon]|nr:hypothetical protein [Candidatus Hodarchaeales archaeon]